MKNKINNIDSPSVNTKLIRNRETKNGKKFKICVILLLQVVKNNDLWIYQIK